MRIAFTSDVHADITRLNERLLPFLVRRIETLSPDLFVLAGDTANGLAALDRTLGDYSLRDLRRRLRPGPRPPRGGPPAGLQRKQDRRRDPHLPVRGGLTRKTVPDPVGYLDSSDEPLEQVAARAIGVVDF